MPETLREKVIKYAKVGGTAGLILGLSAAAYHTYISPEEMKELETILRHTALMGYWTGLGMAGGAAAGALRYLDSNLEGIFQKPPAFVHNEEAPGRGFYYCRFDPKLKQLLTQTLEQGEYPVEEIVKGTFERFFGNQGRFREGEYWSKFERFYHKKDLGGPFKRYVEELFNQNPSLTKEIQEYYQNRGVRAGVIKKCLPGAWGSFILTQANDTGLIGKIIELKGLKPGITKSDGERMVIENESGSNRLEIFEGYLIHQPKIQLKVIRNDNLGGE